MTTKIGWDFLCSPLGSFGLAALLASLLFSPASPAQNLIIKTSPDYTRNRLHPADALRAQAQMRAAEAQARATIEAARAQAQAISKGGRDTGTSAGTGGTGTGGGIIR